MSKTITTAADFLPERISLTALQRAADECRGCELYREATQAVFGEGKRSARLMLVGEAPGDREDELGHPFVGPAGALLDEALVDAGIDRREVYLTNAVKHFRFGRQGARRLHKKPTSRQIQACRPWLEAELSLVHPHVVVCLGATAAQALIRKDFLMTKQRGQMERAEPGFWIIATHHPSAVLRTPTRSDRERKRAELVRDLSSAAAAIHDQ